jgi:hypothetical protein
MFVRFGLKRVTFSAGTSAGKRRPPSSMPSQSVDPPGYERRSLKRRLRIEARADRRLHEKLVRHVARVDVERAAGEVARHVRHERLRHGEVADHQRREHVERDGLSIRLGARQRRAVQERVRVPIAETSDEDVATVDDGGADDALHGVRGVAVRRLRDVLRADGVRSLRRVLAEEELRRGARALDLGLDSGDLFDRRLVGIERDVDLRDLPSDDAHVLHARRLVEIGLHADLIRPGRELEAITPVDV